MPFVAVMVTRSPVAPPETDNEGVVSLVMLSVLEAPLSDAANRSGTDGAAGAVTSTTSDNGPCVAPTFPARSMIDAVTDQVPSLSVGKSQEAETPTT